MQDYQNKSCGQCGEKFNETDEIAICPDCGTPIHRACWNGHCPNEAKHAEGFDWNKSEAAEAYKKTVDAGRPDRSLCALCGEKADNDMIYCPDCGTAMHRGCYAAKGSCPNEENHNKDISDHEFFRNDGFTHEEIIRIGSFSDIINGIRKNPVRDQQTGEELTCHGVTQSELIAYLGEHGFTTPRYLLLFLRMANSRKRASLNFFAGLLMPYYQFYQRMVGPATILLVINFILSLPSSIYQMNVMLNGTSASAMEMTGFGSVITVLSFIGVAIQILVAFFNDYFYMRWSVNRILGLREKYKNLPESQYHEALARAGAPKWSYTLIGIAVSFVISGIVALTMF